MNVPGQELTNKAGKRVGARWPALIASLATGVLFYAMPESLTIGPDWLLLVLIAALMIPTSLAHRTGRVTLNTIFGYSVLGVITLAVVSSLVLLVLRLPDAQGNAQSNFCARRRRCGWPTFWYSHRGIGIWTAADRTRATWRASTRDGAFLFPQMMMDPALRQQMGEDTWSPGFVDYLFLAFNTSTAFSPTDVPVLSRWAKVMMIVQSLISLAYGGAAGRARSQYSMT